MENLVRSVQDLTLVDGNLEVSNWIHKSLNGSVQDEANKSISETRERKPTMKMQQYQCDILLQRRNRLNGKIVRKSGLIDGLLCSSSNCETVRQELAQLDDLFQMLSKVLTEYYNILDHDKKEESENWFDEVEENLCSFKGKI